MDRFTRYQTGLTFSCFFPVMDGKCACGCGRDLPKGRMKWASDKCRDEAYVRFSIIKGNTQVIREVLFSRDGGYCSSCGQYDPYWQADHIKPVSKGGGASELSNFQTLCWDCHKEKTYNLSHQRAISSHAFSTLCIRRLYAPGEDSICSLKMSKEKHILRSAI